MRVEVLVLAGEPDAPVLGFHKVDYVLPEGEEDASHLMDVASALTAAVDEGRESVRKQIQAHASYMEGGDR